MAAVRLHRTRPGRRSSQNGRKPWLQPGRKTGMSGTLVLLALILPVLLFTGTAHAIENTASGTVNASVLDTANATVVLNLVGSAVDPDNSSVTVSPANVPANGTSISTITVVLLDAGNNPVSGKTVTLASDRGAADIITQPAAPGSDSVTLLWWFTQYRDRRCAEFG